MFNRIATLITTALVVSGVALAAPGSNDVQAERVSSHNRRYLLFRLKSTLFYSIARGHSSKALRIAAVPQFDQGYPGHCRRMLLSGGAGEQPHGLEPNRMHPLLVRHHGFNMHDWQ
jgi:hypothetical protein